MNNNKLFHAINKMYSYFQLSLYFWIYLIRGLVIYSLLPSVAALFVTVKALKEHDDDTVKAIYTKAYKNFAGYKLPSFFYSVLITILLAVLVLLSKWEDKPVVMLLVIIVLLYVLALSVIMITYSAYLLTIRSFDPKQLFLFSFVTAFKNYLNTLGLVAIYGVLLYTAFWNFLFFIVFSPFLFALGVSFLFARLKV